jgi:hypothetical protein
MLPAQVLKYLDLSTAHLPEEEFFLIRNAAPVYDPGNGDYIKSPIDSVLPRTIVHEYGMWINVQPPGESERTLARLYPNLFNVLAHARVWDCCWINFDQATDVYEGLPIFDW